MKVKISFPNMISAEQWCAIGLWGTPVKPGQKGKNPESLKQKYFNQTSPVHSIWFADVNNCLKLLRLKSLSTVGQILFSFVWLFSCGHQICTVVYIEISNKSSWEANCFQITCL